MRTGIERILFTGASALLGIENTTFLFVATELVSVTAISVFSSFVAVDIEIPVNPISMVLATAFLTVNVTRASTTPAVTVRPLARLLATVNLFPDNPTSQPSAAAALSTSTSAPVTVSKYSVEY